MQAPTPVLVTSDASFAKRIQADLSKLSTTCLATCTYDCCHQHIEWHRSGTLLLLATDESDFEPLSQLVRVRRLRRSPMRVVVIEAGLKASEALVDGLSSLVDAWLTWPEASSELAEIIGSGPAADGKPETLAERLGAGLKAQTPSLAPLAGRLALAAKHDVTVLLTGETGSGKTYLARLMHENSPRRHERFLAVPCGAQPAELFESSFFGHVKGSFTGAHQTQSGKFASAGKGTILLDEVDTLGFEQQAALLRVIETGEYEMVGSSQTLKSEARLIVASNTDLEEAVQKGQFRQDLFYRLNVMAFHLPPLRERRGDIPFLARGFAAQYALKYRKPIVDIASDALQLLSTFDWSGNLRQLENAVQQAVLVCEGSELTATDLPDELRGNTAPSMAAPLYVVARDSNGRSSGNGNGNGFQAAGSAGTLLRSRAEYERALIQQTLENCHNNRSSAARVLGVSRVTLHKKIKQYHL